MALKSYKLTTKSLMPLFIFILFIILLDIHSAFEEHHDEQHCNSCLLAINEIDLDTPFNNITTPYTAELAINDPGLTSIKSLLSIKSIKPRGPPVPT